MGPLRQGDGTGLSASGFSEVRKGDGTVLWSAGGEIPDSALVQEYDASALSLNDGDSISPFPDERDTTATDLTQNGDGSYETTTNIGGSAAFSDGADDYWISSSTETSGQGITLAFVSEPLQDTEQQVLAHIGNADNNLQLRVVSGTWEAVIALSGSASGGTVSANSTYAGVLTYDGSNVVLDIGDTTDVVNTTISAGGLTGTAIAESINENGQQGNWHNHHILAYDEVKTSSERNEIISSLEDYWGFTSANA